MMGCVLSHCPGCCYNRSSEDEAKALLLVRESVLGLLCMCESPSGKAFLIQGGIGRALVPRVTTADGLLGVICRLDSQDRRISNGRDAWFNRMADWGAPDPGNSIDWAIPIDVLLHADKKSNNTVGPR